MELFLLRFSVIDYEAVDSIVNLRLKLGSGRSFNGERRRSSMCLPLNEFADRVRMFTLLFPSRCIFIFLNCCWIVHLVLQICCLLFQ